MTPNVTVYVGSGRTRTDGTLGLQVWVGFKSSGQIGAPLGTTVDKKRNHEADRAAVCIKALVLDERF